MESNTAQVYLNIVGTVIRITTDQEIFPKDLGKLSLFTINPRAFDLDLIIHAVDKLPEPQGICEYRDHGRMDFRTESGYIAYLGSVGITLDGAYMRITKTGSVSCALIKRSAFINTITSRVILEAMDLERHTIENDCFLFHCSYIIHHDKAILFTAPSGTGKSTQADLWNTHRNAEIINGDRAAVAITESGALAMGLPFSGSSGICKNISRRICAIVSLKQASETHIRKLNSLEAFRKVWEGCAIPLGRENLIEKCYDNVMKIIETIPIYSLECTPDESAVLALESVLKGEGL